MATETKYAGTVQEVTSSPFNGGNTNWVDPANAQGDTTSTFAEASGGGAWTAYGLYCDSFGFVLVSGTINSILVEIEALQSDSGSTFAIWRIIKGGTVGSNTAQDGATVPTVKGFRASGATLWGLTWTAADITASTFGTAFNVNQPNGFPPGINTRVFRVRITVDYTPAAGNAHLEIVPSLHEQQIMIPTYPHYFAVPY